MKGIEYKVIDAISKYFDSVESACHNAHEVFQILHSDSKSNEFLSEYIRTKDQNVRKRINSISCLLTYEGWDMEECEDIFQKLEQEGKNTERIAKLMKKIQTGLELALMPKTVSQDFISSIEDFLLQKKSDQFQSLQEFENYVEFCERAVDHNIPFFWLPHDIQKSMVGYFINLQKQGRSPASALGSIRNNPLFKAEIQKIRKEQEKDIYDYLQNLYKNASSLVQRYSTELWKMDFHIPSNDLQIEKIMARETAFRKKFQLSGFIQSRPVAFYLDTACIGLANKKLYADAEEQYSFETAVEWSKDALRDFLNVSRNSPQVPEKFPMVHISDSGFNSFSHFISHYILEEASQQQKPQKIAFANGEYHQMIELCRSKSEILTHAEKRPFDERPDASLPPFPVYSGSEQKYIANIKDYFEIHSPDFFVISTLQRTGRRNRLDLLYQAWQESHHKPKVIFDGCQGFSRQEEHLEKYDDEFPFMYLFSAQKAAGVKRVGGYLCRNMPQSFQEKGIIHEEYNGGGVDERYLLQFGAFCSQYPYQKKKHIEDKEKRENPELNRLKENIAFQRQVTAPLHNESSKFIKLLQTLGGNAIKVISPWEGEDNIPGIIEIAVPGVDIHEMEKALMKKGVTVRADWGSKREGGSFRISLFPDQNFIYESDNEDGSGKKYEQSDYFIAVIGLTIIETARELKAFKKAV